MSSFQSQRGDRFEYDALVFGSGISGLTYILDLLKHRPQTRIALITKTNFEESNSRYAQGGIAAPEIFSDSANTPQSFDSIESHIEDTLKAGDGICNEQAVREIINDAPQRISDLIERGVTFDQKSGGDFDLGLEGGHSQRRIYRCGDRSGLQIMDCLFNKVREAANVKIFEHHSGINFITQVERHKPGSLREALGAYVLDTKKKLIHTFIAKVIILATGGAGKIFRYTTNPDIATGDGIAMAFRAGARVGNLEFYQFHPTLLYHTKINNFLLSEALRGEGAYLRLPDTEERFMKRYAPDKMELATRDKVSRAIFTEIERSSYNFVYLDIRHKKKDFLVKHFPQIFEKLDEFGLDMSKDLIPVVPAAHYLCGGILTDTNGQTDINRLYVIGESAFSGLHGANRLASNALMEGVVMAHHAALKSKAWFEKNPKLNREICDWDSKSVRDPRRATQITAHWRGLRGEMNSYAGIIRTEDGLKDLLKLNRIRKEIIEDYYWHHRISRDLIELRNIILLSDLMTRSALYRRESRGVHFREDFPNQFPTAEDSIFRYNEIYPFERPSP